MRIILLAAMVPVLCLLGCSNSPPPRDPDAIQKETEKVRGEIERELQNK
jgi:hypothetical protein